MQPYSIGMRTITLLCLTMLSGCAVVQPPGWSLRREPPMVIAPTPHTVSVGPPRSWDLPDGRVVRLDVDTVAVGTFATLQRADIEFTIAFRDFPSDRISCQTDPEIAGFPETRFGCWSEGLEFWLTPGGECAQSFQTRLESDCWNGSLMIDGRLISLVRGRMERSELPVGQIAWVSEDVPLLAADTRNEHQLRVYDVGAEMSDELRNQLLLLTVAIYYFERATDLD